MIQYGFVGSTGQGPQRQGCRALTGGFHGVDFSAFTAFPDAVDRFKGVIAQGGVGPGLAAVQNGVSQVGGPDSPALILKRIENGHFYRPLYGVSQKVNIPAEQIGVKEDQRALSSVNFNVRIGGNGLLSGVRVHSALAGQNQRPQHAAGKFQRRRHGIA